MVGRGRFGELNVPDAQKQIEDESAPERTTCLATWIPHHRYIIHFRRSVVTVSHKDTIKPAPILDLAFNGLSLLVQETSIVQ